VRAQPVRQLLTGGLSYSDFRAIESVQGTFRDYTGRVEAYYAERYGADSAQVRQSFHGAHAEPGVSLIVLTQMLKDQPLIRLITGVALVRSAPKQEESPILAVSNR